jgi:uncharacterized membrane-anchored protein
MRVRSAIAIVACALSLALVNWTIVRRERHLRDGRTVYLEIGAGDPRSLMQGDYMALHFLIADELLGPDAGDGGYVVVSLDERSVARFVRVDRGAPLAPEEVRIRYRVRFGSPRFATNAYFFQEGDAELYASARYGEFRIDDAGELLLTGLRNDALERLGPS